MADTEGLKVAKDYHVDTPFANQKGFYVKGANSLDWGMKKHLSNIFDPKSGNTVMFAFDHGYLMGSTAGLERLDLLLPKLAPYVDVFMGTRGAIRACVPPEITKGIALRVSSGSSMLNDDLSHEVVAVDIEDAIRMNADCMAVQTFIGADGQLASIDNLSRTINAGFRYSIPTLGVVAVGKQMERTDRFFKLATRIVAEMGVQLVKTYNCENFEEIVAACQDGSYRTKYNPGNYKKLNLGAQGNITMQIVAVNMDTQRDGSFAPLTWMSMELLKTTHRFNVAVESTTDESGNTVYTLGTGTVGGYAHSELRTYLKETIKPLIPAVVRNEIKEVLKYSKAYDPDQGKVVVMEHYEELWIPTNREIGSNWVDEQIGPNYKVVYGNTSAARQKKVIGESRYSSWWLRTAASNNSYYLVTDGGGIPSTDVTRAYGICLGFCI